MLAQTRIMVTTKLDAEILTSCLWYLRNIVGK